MLFQRVIVSFVLFTLSVSAETDYRFAFPQSELLLGIDIQWLMKSPFGDAMRKELKANIGELKPLEMMLEQVDSVHLSVVSKNSRTSDLLMLVQGRFESSKLIEMAGKLGYRTDQWGKVRVLMPQRTKLAPSRKVAFQQAQFKMDMASTKPIFALVDDKHIVIGEEAPLRVALERMETGLVPQANPLFERARDLEAANDVWLIGSTAPLNLNAAAGKGSDPMAQLASQVRSFAVGIAVRRNVSIDMQLQATSAKAAAQMLDLAKGAVAMAKMSPNAAEELPFDFDKVLQLTSSGNVIKATLSMEQSELEKVMAARLKPAKPATQGVVATAKPEVTAVAVKPVAPVAPTRKTVIIYGLAGGPKEVPVN